MDYIESFESHLREEGKAEKTIQLFATKNNRLYLTEN